MGGCVQCSEREKVVDEILPLRCTYKLQNGSGQDMEVALLYSEVPLPIIFNTTYDLVLCQVITIKWYRHSFSGAIMLRLRKAAKSDLTI